MAAKRFFDDDEDQPNQKRMKTRPSFASVIREVVMVNFFENFCSSLEPMLRRVVSEEVENGLRRRCMMRSMIGCPSSMRMIEQGSGSGSGCSRTDQHEYQQVQPNRTFQLAFNERLSLPIFTNSKIVDIGNNPLQIILLETSAEPAKHNHLLVPPANTNYSIKVEIVVLDGDFLPTTNGAGDDINHCPWTSEEFEKNIVKERSGKRPLLTGDHLNNVITMRDGVGLVGDIEFTDNSSWIRSRKFRIGARVINIINGTHGHHVTIREAITEPFVVKDHRGELYKKHHPPALDDQVWRLEKIGKGGTFHQKLSSHGINTVQDFLKLFVVDSSRLRKILGVGMSEKMWEATSKHAKTCVIGTKQYLYRCLANNYTLTLSPICQLIKADFNGQLYSQNDLKRIMHAAYIESLVKDAYANWNSLEEVDGLVLTQGNEVVGEYPSSSSDHEQQLAVRSYVSSCSVMQNIDRTNGGEGDYSDEWKLNPAGGGGGFYLSPAAPPKTATAFSFFSESTSDDDVPD